jgi:hypothetical protein
VSCPELLPFLNKGIVSALPRRAGLVPLAGVIGFVATAARLFFSGAEDSNANLITLTLARGSFASPGELQDSAFLSPRLQGSMKMTPTDERHGGPAQDN